MTIEEAIEVISLSFDDPESVTRDEARIAKELAIDALLSVKRVRGTCGACLPYLLIGETPPDEEPELE